MTGKYHTGTLPLPDKVFRVETIKQDGFVFLGKVTVKGEEVGEEMDRAQSIKGHEYSHIAQRKAEKKFPKANTVIVTAEEI